jgi:hypothetical protein
MSNPMLLNWTVPQEAPPGLYNIRIVIWKESPSLLLLDHRLDESTQYRVFTVLGSFRLVYAIPELISLVPPFIFSLVKDKKTVRKSSIALYGFSSLAYGTGLSFQPFSTGVMFQFLALIFLLWGLATLTFRLLYKRKYSHLFSYRCPGSLAIGILIYTYLAARLDILLLSVSLLFLANWMSSRISAKTMRRRMHIR